MALCPNIGDTYSSANQYLLSNAAISQSTRTTLYGRAALSRGRLSNLSSHGLLLYQQYCYTYCIDICWQRQI